MIILTHVFFIFLFIKEVKASNMTLDDKFDYLVSEISSLNKRFDTLEKRFDTLENRFDTLEKRFDTLENRFDELRNTITGKYAISSSDKSVGIIEINSGSKAGNIYASGNLVTINGKYYFSTCKHVVYDQKNNKFRDIHLIRLKDGPTLNLTGKGYTFIYDDNSHDYALLEVKASDSIINRSATISVNRPNLSTKIQGYSLRDVGTVFVEGKIVEEDTTTGVYQSNCGGSHGFSGCGYFNDEGELIVIHRGQGTILDEVSSNADFEGFQEDNLPISVLVNRFIKYCFEEYNNTQCEIYTIRTNSAIARNPRTTVLEARKFYDLLNNSSRGIIEFSIQNIKSGGGRSKEEEEYL